MQRLVMKNFGPVKTLDIEIKDFILLVGPQASGKSTIAKTIFFFKSITTDITSLFTDYIKGNKNVNLTVLSIKKVISRKFLDYFGPSSPLSGMELIYYYSDDSWVKITLEETHNYVTPDFSENIINNIKQLIRQVKVFAQQNNSVPLLSISDFMRKGSDYDAYISLLETQIQQVFEQNHDLLYIPAGRSLLSTLSDQLQSIDTRCLDCLMKQFIQKIAQLRPVFANNFEDLIKSKMLLLGLGSEKIDFSRVRLAEKIINNILKGKYRYDKDGEKIYLAKGSKDSKYVKLNFASSGQQESLWILLLLFVAILEQQNIFVVIEEPEAHLYPDAQKSISALIALLSNIKQSQVVITTHSPYILASINNLILAHKVSKQHPAEVQNKINKNLWIDRNKVYAAILQNGEASEIIDSEFDIIKQDVIDGVSHVINEEFDFLFSYEIDEEN